MNMSTGERKDPYAAFRFLVEIDGITMAGFSECSVLTGNSGRDEYRTSSEDVPVHKITGLNKFGKIILKRGIVNLALWERCMSVKNGAPKRISGRIVLLNDFRTEILRLNFNDGWPTMWKGAAPITSANEIPIETLEIAHEGFEREAVWPPAHIDSKGAIAVSQEDRDLKEAVLTILGTTKGERVMQPEYGCGIHDRVFDPINEPTLTGIEDDVRAALRRWEPRIEVLDIKAEQAEDEANEVLIYLHYRILSSNCHTNIIYPFHLLTA
jgi:phage tail-like protein